MSWLLRAPAHLLGNLKMDEDEDEHDVKVQMQFKQTSSATRRK